VSKIYRENTDSGLCGNSFSGALPDGESSSGGISGGGVSIIYVVSLLLVVSILRGVTFHQDWGLNECWACNERASGQSAAHPYIGAAAQKVLSRTRSGSTASVSMS
jgi:hypothetical protein